VNKKSKNDDQNEVEVDEENNVVEMNANNDDNYVHENNSIDDNDLDNDVPEEDESDEEIVKSDLAVGSKNKKSRTKKTVSNNLVCEADSSFILMHGPGDFSSLGFNNFESQK
jgi:hypothetical protein